MTAGDLETELMPIDGGAWVLIRSPDASLAIAPPTVSRPELPATLQADVLVLGRSTSLGAISASDLRDAGVRVVIAPHPQLPEIVARAVDEAGEVLLPEDPFAPARLVGSAQVRADGGNIEVRR